MPRKPPLHRQTQLHAQYAKQRDDDDPLEASSPPRFVTALHLAKERRRQDIDAARDAAAVSVGNSAAAAATTTGEPQGPLRAAAVTLFPIRECPRSISALLDEARRRRVKTLRRDLLPRDELAAREAIERTFWTDVFIASVERSMFMFRQIDGPRARAALMRRIAHELRNMDQSGEGSARLGVERLEATHRSLLEQLCTTVGATLAQQCAAAGALLQERLRLDRRIFDAAATVARALRKNAWKKQRLRSCVKNAQSIRRKDLALCVERAWQLYCNRIKGREQLRLLRHSYTRRDAIDARESGERLQISSRCLEKEHRAFACTLCSGAALPITFSHLVLSDTIPSLWEGSGGMAKLRFLYSECLGEHFAAEARAAFVATRTPLLLAAEQLQRAAIEHHWATNPVNSVAAWRAGLRLLSALRLLHLRRSRTRRWLIAELLERRTAAALLGQRLWRGCAARCRVRFLRINRDERAVRCGIEREECATWALQIGTAAVGNHQLIDLCDVQRQELEGRECVARVMCHHLVAMLDRAAAFAAFLEAVERNSRADISAARNRGAAARHLSRVAKAAVSRLFLGRLRHLLRSETEHRAFFGESLEFLQRATIVTIHETMIDESVVAQWLLLEGAVLACVFGDVVTPEVSQRRSLVRNFSETLEVMQQRRDAATQLLTRVTISLRSRRAFASWTSHQRREQRLRTNIEVDALLAAAELCFSHVAALQFEATLALRKRAWALQNDDTALRLRRLVTEEHSRRGDLEDAATRLAAVHELEAEALAAAAASKAGLQSGAHQSYEESEEVDIDSYDEEDEEGEEEDFDDEETEDYEEEDEEDEEDDVSGDADGGGERRFSVESTRSPLVPTVRTAMPSVTVTMIEDAETAARRRGIVVWAQALAKMHHTFLETMPSTSPRTSSDHDGNDSSSAASSGIDDEDGDDALSMVSASELERAAAGAAVAEAQEEPEVQPPPLSNSPTVAFLTPDAETLLAAVVSTESLCRKQLVAAEADDSLLLGVFAAELAGRARIDTAAASSQGLQNIVTIHRTLQLLNESAKNAETPDTSDVSSTSSASDSSSLSSSASSSAASTPRGVPLDAPPTAAANAAAAAVALETAEAATRAQLESLENWARATMFLEHDESVARAGLIVESTSCSAFATILLKHQTIQMYLDVDGEDLSESNSADHDDSSVSAASRDLIAQFTQQAFAELAENSADVKIRVCVPQEQVHRRHIVQRRVLDVKMMYAESVEAKARLQVERSEVAARQRLSADAPPRQALSPQPQPQLPMVEAKRGPLIGGSLLEVHAQAQSLLLHQFTRLVLDALEATEQLQRRDALAVRTTDLKYYFAEYKSGLVRATITRQERYLRGKIHATFEAARVAIEYTDTHNPAAVRVLREHKAARDELLQLDLGWRVEALGTCEQLSRRAIAEQRILAVKCLFVQHREGAARTALQRQVYRGPAWANVLQAFSDIETAATAAGVAAAAHPTHDGVAPTASDASQQDARSASVDSLEAAQNLRWA